MSSLQDPASVLERVSDGFVALDREWRYTYVNTKAAGLFGRRPADLIGRHIWSEFPEGVGQPFHLAYERAMSEQLFISMESYYQPWDRWFENRIYPSKDGLSIFFHEITERKRAEQAAAENADLLRGQNEVLGLIARGAPLAETLDVLLRFVESHADGMLSSILLVDPDGVHVRHGAAPSLPVTFTGAIDGATIGPLAGSCGTATFLRRPVIVADIATDPLWAGYRELALQHGLRACWSTPILDPSGDVLGTFALYFREPAPPTERHRTMVDMATHTAAVAVVKHRETDALRDSEERLRLAVTRGSVGIWEWDLVSDRLVWNDQLKRMFGWRTGNERLSFAMFMEAVHPDDRARVVDGLERAMAGRASYDDEFRVVRPEGLIQWVAAKGDCEYDSAGRPVRMLGVALDITDRKRTEDAVRRREAQLAEAQRIAGLGSYEWDVDSGTVERSEELCRIFGVRPEQFEPTFEAYLARVHPADQPATRETIRQAFAGHTPFDLEERIVRPDGAIRVLHSQGRWVLDGSERPLKLVGICQDVTERRQADDLLRRSEERFQIVARATNDAIWDWDLVAREVWWNQAITTVFGYSADTIAADVEWRLARVHPDDVDAVASGIQTVMDRHAQVWSGEYRFRRADGSFADVFDRAYVVYDEKGTPARVIGAMADVSERKRTLELLEQRVASRTHELLDKNLELEGEIARRRTVERLLRTKNDELKAFAYTVSHDLKAPLRGIAGYAQELDRRHRSGLGDRARHCLQQIVGATRSLDRLIDDLLHYARLEAETAADTTVDLSRVVEGILRDRQRVIAAHQAEITVRLCATSVRTWERGIVQVLTNLIDNALKYSRDAHPPRIGITSENQNGALLIAISDNGIGFDMKYHDRMFGLFNRLVRQEDYEGTGAGLAIVKKVVDKLGGSVWAESQPGAGAAFFVTVPTTLAPIEGDGL